MAIFSVLEVRLWGFGLKKIEVGDAGRFGKKYQKSLREKIFWKYLKRIKTGYTITSAKTEVGGRKNDDEAVSCGGVVISWKIPLCIKNQNGGVWAGFLQRELWRKAETYRQTALREVKEESGANGEIIKYVGKTQYL